MTQLWKNHRNGVLTYLKERECSFPKRLAGASYEGLLQHGMHTLSALARRALQFVDFAKLDRV
ncbi:MAG: hypothetical protein AAFV97_04340 [Bacteroidota bacterium]